MLLISSIDKRAKYFDIARRTGASEQIGVIDPNEASVVSPMSSQHHPIHCISIGPYVDSCQFRTDLNRVMTAENHSSCSAVDVFIVFDCPLFLISVRTVDY